MKQRPLVQAVGLALLLGSFQLHGAERESADSGGGVEMELTGLVALDTGFHGEDDYINEAQQGIEGDCPGPSGCVADLNVQQLLLGESAKLPMETRTAWVRVQNNPLSGIAAEDAKLRLYVWPDFEVEATGCTVKQYPNIVECDIGELAIGETWSKSVRIRQLSIHAELNQLWAEVSASTPDPNPDNDWLAAMLEQRYGDEPFGRITSIDASNCPAVVAEVSLGDTLGRAEPGPVPGGGVFLEVTDNGQWLGSPHLVGAGVDEVSMVFVLDNGAGLGEADFSAQKNAIAAVATTWYADAQSQSRPAPALAVLGTGGSARPIKFSQNVEAFIDELNALEPSPAPGQLFQRLYAASEVLRSRVGSTSIVTFMQAADVQSEQSVDPTEALLEFGVPIYPVVLSPSLEPLARRIAAASGGFRRIAFDGVPDAVQSMVDTVRYASRLGWNAPVGGHQAREVSIRRLGAFSGFVAERTYSQNGTPCTATCYVSRDLPESIAPDWTTSSPVRLSIDPLGSTLQFALVENVPIGWSVSSISDGGVFDSVARQIRWDGKSINEPAEFSYQIRWTASELLDWGSIRNRLVGTLAVNSVSLPVCGDSELLAAAAHPLDRAGSLFVGPLFLPSYEESWLHGQPWLRGISPIPVSHLTRGAQIASSGSLYQFNLAAAIPWVSVSAPLPPYVESAQRQAAEVYEPGQPFQVQLVVTPHAGTIAGAIEEVPPGGWQIVSIGQDGVYDPVSRTIRWGLFQDDQPRLVEYELLPPVDASGGVRFLGRYSVDGEQVDFGGTVVVGNVFEDAIFSDGFE